MRYAYEDAAGRIHWHEQPLSAGAPPAEIPVYGGQATAKRCYRAEVAGVPATKGWPLECLASGVNAADAQALRDEFKRVGVPTEVSEDGNPIYTDAAHRRRALKARGLVDRSSYI